MLTDLSTGDFDFYRDYAQKMKTCHDREFMQEIEPDLIRAFYRGRKQKDNRFTRAGVSEDDKHLLMLTMVFSAANTILPNLYYQNPGPIITPLRNAGPDNAALLTALIKHYMKLNNAKYQNQDACLNGYFFGIGWKKIGYQLVSAPNELIAEEPESRVPDQVRFMDMFKNQDQQKPDAVQSKPRFDFVEYEGLFNASESPLNVAVDHKADLFNRKATLHFLPRTLYDLMNFGGYDKAALDEFYKKHKHARGSRLDTREIDVTVNELEVQQRNGLWILAWIEGFDKPLMYEKSTLQGKGDQFEPLVFTNEPGVRYPISHMKLACQVQEKIDKMASTFYENVARARNMLFINEKDLAKGSLDAILQNKIQGIALTNKPLNPGTFAHAQSPAVQNDLPSLIAICQQSLIEIMGTDQQLVSGRSKNKTLGQDELARVGTQIRESGMQDRVRDWMIAQFTKECKLLQQYSEAELELEITGEDYADPVMAEKFQRETVRFMTMDNPIGAKRFIEGDYDYDVNIEEALKPDSEAIRQGIERIIATGSNPVISNSLNEDGVRIRTSLLFKEWINTFSFLGNTKKFLEPINSLQLAAIQAKQVLMGQMGKGGGMPTPSQGKADMAGKPEPGPDVAMKPKSSEAAVAA